jgi:site-specific DNA-cytosine methylase
MSRHANGAGYHVEHMKLDTKFFKVPQSRPRIWIVCVRQDMLDGPLIWPTPSATPCIAIDDMLGPRPPRAEVEHALPPESQVNSRTNTIRSLDLIRSGGTDPFGSTFVIDIDHSKSRKGTRMLGCSPCLTRSRAVTGGHWISTHGRRLSVAEMMRLQNMRPDRLEVPDSVPASAFRGMIGNSMSVNVVEALLAMLSKAAPRVMQAGTLPDRWSFT